MPKHVLRLPHFFVVLLKEVRPLVNQFFDAFDALWIDWLSVLGKVHCNRLKVGKSEAVWVLWALSSKLIAEGNVEITYLAKNVTLKIEDKVVW